MQAKESRGVGLWVRRLVNLLGKPFGINLFPRAFPPVSSASMPIEDVFEEIYSTNKWGSAESLSGVGSELGRAASYRERLTRCLLDKDVRSIFDAPCGDLNWILPIATDTRFAYRGGDISKSLIASVRKRYPQIRVEEFDICRSPFPEADVWHCRDCLFHLPFAEVRRSLKNFAQSSIPYALLTTHAVAYMRNLDVSAGGFRYLDLERPPFALPRALAYLRDFRIGLDFRAISAFGRGTRSRPVFVTKRSPKMCGIAGIWRAEPPTEEQLTTMARSLRHRGPDDHGIWIEAEAGVGFAHTRLAIVDLSAAGHQPMRSASGRYELVYNGEIYNHEELRSLVDPNDSEQWRGHSDTETLLALIERFGLKQALAKSTGMFALALWDRETRTMSLARDRLGEKPLYYGWADGSFLFASELKAMRGVPGFNPPVDRTSLDSLLRYLAVPAPRTIYQGIFKLMPGTILTLANTHRTARPSGFDGRVGSMISAYWSIEEVVARGPSTLHSDDAEALLEQLLIASVQRQSVADVPVGTFLSGGYDSSLVAALQQAHGGSRVETFTIGFEEAGFDEAPFARAVAEHLGTEHHEIRVSAADALAMVPQLPSIYDEPFADSSQIPTTLLCRLARRHVTVALSGDGGDELFGGYNRYLALECSQRALAAVPSVALRGAGALLGAIGSDWIDRLGAWTRLDRKFPQPGLKSQKLATMLRHGDDPEKLYAALIAQWDERSRPVSGLAPCAPHLPPFAHLDVQSRMMAWDLGGYLPNDVLAKVDRASMSASLETRAPFLDHHVVEHALGLPSSAKIGPEGGKAIMRRILYRYVPRELLDRPKAGFAIPLGQWLRGPLRDWAEALLDPAVLSDMFDVAEVRGQWQIHLNGRRDNSAAIWPVLMFQGFRESL